MEPNVEMEESLLAEFFRHNTWATLRLLDACESLTDEQLDTTTTGTMGTIRDTLVHIAGAEQRYLNLLSGLPREEPLERKPFPGVTDLRERAQRTGDGLAKIAARASLKDTIAVPWQGETTQLNVSTVLIQAINHATEHRSHINTILTQLGMEPPELDGWTYGDR